MYVKTADYYIVKIIFYLMNTLVIYLGVLLINDAIVNILAHKSLCTSWVISVV